MCCTNSTMIQGSARNRRTVRTQNRTQYLLRRSLVGSHHTMGVTERGCTPCRKRSALIPTRSYSSLIQQNGLWKRLWRLATPVTSVYVLPGCICRRWTRLNVTSFCVILLAIKRNNDVWTVPQCMRIMFQHTSCFRLQYIHSFFKIEGSLCKLESSWKKIKIISEIKD